MNKKPVVYNLTEAASELSVNTVLLEGLLAKICPDYSEKISEDAFTFTDKDVKGIGSWLAARARARSIIAMRVKNAVEQNHA